MKLISVFQAGPFSILSMASHAEYVNNHLLVDNRNVTLFVYIHLFSNCIYLLCAEG